MALTIHSSIFASRSSRSLSRTQGTLAETLRRLSSGVRLGVAADDPGRLGSVILSTAQSRGVRQSIRNLNDGLSLSQTLEGGLAQLEVALQRLRQLSVQAGNETLNAQDRSALQDEATQIIAHLDAVVEQTKFNQIGLLDGSADDLEIFTEPSRGTTSSAFKLDLVKVSPNEVNRQASYQSQRRGVYLGDLNNGDLKVNGVSIRGTDDVDDEYSFSYKSGSAIAKANAINAYAETTGVTARALVNKVTANRTISAFTLDTQSYFAINGVKLTGMHIVDYDADGALRDAINSVSEETGVVASLNSQGELHLVAEDGRNIQIHYSDMFTMVAIGLADTSGDETNLKGDVLKSSIYDVDLFGSIQHVSPSFHSYGGNVTVGGEFDPGRDHVDYVAQVIKGGNFGTAEFRLARETGSETLSAEDYAFLDLDGPYATSQTNGMEFFSASPESETNGVTGSISSTGTYNEGADRTYTITVTQEGSTDGAVKAVGDISSNVDGVIHNNVVLSGTITLGTALNQTGEFVTLNLSGTPRGQSVSESGTAQPYSQAITQNDAAVNGVIISGTYTADIDVVKQVRVIETGYTQGTNSARLQVFDSFDGGAFVAGAAFTISTGGTIDIGHGLKIEFTPEGRQLSHNVGDTINRTGAASSYDSTGRTVTMNASTLQFVGERGDGTYILNVTEAGRTGRAKYEVLFDDNDGDAPVQVAAPAVLNSGVVTLADGLTFNFDPSTPEVGATSATVDLSAGDHYGDLITDYQNPNFTFGGAYTGDLNDTTVEVEVTTEGRVLDAGEANTGDAAVLTYTIAGTVAGATITGSTLARVGTYNLGEGVTFTITAASDQTKLNLNGADLAGATHNFGAGAVLGYGGEVKVALDDDLFDRNRDVTLRLSEIGDLIVGDAGGAASSGKLLAELVDEQNVVVTSASFSVTSGVTYVIDPGLEINFDNSSFTALDITPAGGNDDSTANIELAAGAVYNNSLGDKDYLITFKNPTSESVAQLNTGADTVDNVGGAEVSLAGDYSGHFGDQTIDVSFEGTETQVTQNVIGGADAAALTTEGVFSGAGGDQSLTVTFLGATLSVSPANFAPDSFKVETVGGNYDGLSGDKDLTVTFTGQQQEVINLGSFTGNLTVTNDPNLSRGPFVLSGNFTADNTLSITSSIDGSSQVFSLANGVNDITLGGTLGLGEIDLRVQVTGADETLQAFSISFDPTQTVLISDGDGATADVSVDLGGVGPVTIDLSHADFSGVGKMFASDPGFDLKITGATQEALHQASITMRGPKANVFNGAQLETVDISLGEIDLTSGTFSGAGKMFASGSPGVKLKISDPHLSENDSWTVNLKTKSTVTLTGDGGVINGVTLSGAGLLDLDKLSVADKTNLLGGTFNHAEQFGVQLNFVNVDLQVDDTFRLDLAKTPTINVKEVGAGGAGVDYALGSEFGAVNFDLNGVLEVGKDPGFDLKITDPVLGRDDSYTLSLKGAQVTAANDDLISLNARTLQENDVFTANLTADELEIGTRYSVDVTAPHLNQGHIYEVEENVGTLKVGEQLVVGPLLSRFEPTVYTMQASVTITDGLNLKFDTNGPFEVGDEVRFQARGYRGDYSVSGQYTDPAYPTTFMVEVTQTGDVDGGAGGALIKTTRLDTNVVVSDNVEAVSIADTGNIGGDGYLGLGVFMQFDAHGGAGEAHRLYQGDRFFIDVIGSLSQNFASQIMLESDDNIEIEYSSVDVDNELGRLLYVGDIADVNNPGTLDSLQIATLGVNVETSVSKIDFSTQETSEEAMRLIDDALQKVSDTRTRNGAAQNRMSRELLSLEEFAYQTERSRGQILDADIAIEVARQTKALISQQAGAQLLNQINQFGLYSLELVQALTR